MRLHLHPITLNEPERRCNRTQYLFAYSPSRWQLRYGGGSLLTPGASRFKLLNDAGLRCTATTDRKAGSATHTIVGQIKIRRGSTSRLPGRPQGIARSTKHYLNAYRRSACACASATSGSE